MWKKAFLLFVMICIRVCVLAAQDKPENQQSSEPNITEQSPKPVEDADMVTGETNSTLSAQESTTENNSNTVELKTDEESNGESEETVQKETFNWIKNILSIIAPIVAVAVGLLAFYKYRHRIFDLTQQVITEKKVGAEFEREKELGKSLVFEEQYRATLKAELGTVKMLGSPDVPNVPVDLLDTFVSLDITAMSAGQHRENTELKSECVEMDRKLSPESALRRTFEKYRMLLILGDPGCGKTTLVKYYAMLCLKGERHNELGFDDPPFVVYLPLREIESKDGELCPLHESLAKWASKHYLSVPAETFLGWLKGRQTLILLDGLDEISELDRREAICRWIDEAAAGLTKARFVVTSRWTGYRKVDGIELSFDHLRADVRDFSTEQQAEFLEKWFVAAYLRVPHDEKIPDEKWREGQRQRGLDRANAIVDYLAKDENRGVRELAVVPMLLQVIAILWRERENLPQGRADLYQAALKYLLDFRDRRRKIKPLMPATQALRVLCPVSFWMQDELHADEVKKDKLHGKMQEKLVNMKDNVPAEKFCENLRDRAGLIADYGDDAYIFRHKSFREWNWWIKPERLLVVLSGSWRSSAKTGGMSRCDSLCVKLMISFLIALWMLFSKTMSVRNWTRNLMTFF